MQKKSRNYEEVHTSVSVRQYTREGEKRITENRFFICRRSIIDDRMKVEIETTFVYKSICHVDTDAVDRLNNRYTTIALVACFLIIAGKIYVGNPINCWAPGKFRKLILAWVKRINHDYCQLLQLSVRI